MAKKLPQYAQTAPVLFKCLIVIKNSAVFIYFVYKICLPIKEIYGYDKKF